MNKRGALTDIFIWMAVGFVCVVFFGLWIYAHNLLTNSLLELGQRVSSSSTNITYATEVTFGAINVGLGELRWLAVILFVGMGISILLSNFLVKAHPAFFIVYLFLSILAVIFAVYISNAYEGLMTNEVFGVTLSSFSGGSWILLHLPIWASVVGIFGAVFLFAGIIRDSGTGGSPLY